MTTYYVGPGGNDGSAGTSWGTRKLTLNGAEDIPVVAGDTVYVGPGTYRELLTVDVSGSSGSLISYIGDYTGANTDGTGGTVRITGSDNDQTATRTNCITSGGQHYRLFSGFVMDMSSSIACAGINSAANWTIQDCVFTSSGGNTAAIQISGTGAGWTIQRCMFQNGSRYGIELTHTSVVDNTGHVIENCVFLGNSRGVSTTRVGGATIRNCLFSMVNTGARISTALNTGQTITVNNCIFYGVTSEALRATTTGEITEDYNTFFANNIDRTNTATGSNSIAYPMLPDNRWFFESTLGNGTLVTPFDLASYSPLVELNSGTGAPSADVRGTTVQGTYREWGPLEYDSTLDTEAGAGGASVYRRVARILGG